jgi:hypothetical protein
MSDHCYYFEGLGEGLGSGDGRGVGSGFKSLGPTWPMKGRWWPMPRMMGTVREPCS